jgi:arylsulfatase A
VKWPGVTEAGSVSDALVSQIDIMATIAGAVGFDLPDDSAEDSHDLMPLLKGESKAVRDSHVHNTREDKWAMRQGDWVLIQGKDGYHSGRDKAWEEKRGYPADDKEPVELYNLSADIGQKNNLASRHPEKVKALQGLLGQIREQGFSAPRLAK